MRILRGLQLSGMFFLCGGLLIAADPELLQPPQRDPRPKQPTVADYLRGLLNGTPPAPAVKTKQPEKRDPFATTNKMVKQAGVTPTARGAALPSLRLRGLARDSEGAIAILEVDASGSIFVRAGDVINAAGKGQISAAEYKVVRIDRDSVVVEIAGRTLVLR